MDLSLNLRPDLAAPAAQAGPQGRVPAVEVMLNSPLISDLIFKGEVPRSRTS
jgi:twitching motility protein PilU